MDDPACPRARGSARPGVDVERLRPARARSAGRPRALSAAGATRAARPPRRPATSQGRRLAFARDAGGRPPRRRRALGPRAATAAGGLRRQADRLQGHRPAARRLAAGARARRPTRGCVVVGFGALPRRVERLAARSRPATSRARGAIARGGPRRRGRPARAAALPARVPRPATAREPAYPAAAAACPSASSSPAASSTRSSPTLLPAAEAHGGPQHVPRGVRHGRRRGRGVRGAAGRRRALGARRGRRHARRPTCPRRGAAAARPSSSADGAVARARRRVAGWLEAPAGAARGGRARRSSRPPASATRGTASRAA